MEASPSLHRQFNSKASGIDDIAEADILALGSIVTELSRSVHLAAALPYNEHNEQAMIDYLAELKTKLKAIEIGGMLLVPCGWWRGPTRKTKTEQRKDEKEKKKKEKEDKKVAKAERKAAKAQAKEDAKSKKKVDLEQEPEEPSDSDESSDEEEEEIIEGAENIPDAQGFLPHTGHAYGMVVERVTKFEFRVAVVNTGEGLEYHPVTADCPPKIKRQVALVVNKVPLPRLLDSSFWFLALRTLVWPSSHVPGVDFDRLLVLVPFYHREVSIGSQCYWKQ